MPGFTYDGVHSDAFFIVNSTNREILPHINNRLLSVPNRPGAYSFGIDVGIRKFSLDVTLIYSSVKELRAKVREIAGWLYSEKPKPLVFDDEPGMTYYALLSDDTTLDQMGSAGFGKLTFICPDPYAYGAEQTASGTLNNPGNAKCPFTVETTLQTISSDLIVTNGEKFVRLIWDFVSGDLVQIDFYRRKIYINQNLRMTSYDVRQSQWFQLDPGENNIDVTPESALLITYRPRWL